MADYTPVLLDENLSWTYKAGGTITGGDVVMVSAAASASAPNGTVITASGASNAVVGVAGHDAVNGQDVTVVRGGVQELISAAAITAPATVRSAASGRVGPWTAGTDPADQPIGLAVTTVAGAGLPVRVVWTK